MTWFRVDDTFPEHPKLEGLEDNPRLWADAMALWLVAGCYCARHSTDGKVSWARLARLSPMQKKRATSAARALIDARLWSETDDGIAFHDWDSYNPTRAQVAEQRQKKSEKQAKWRAKSAKTPRDGPPVDGLQVGLRDGPGGDGGDCLPSYARAVPDPTRPDPTRSLSSESERARAPDPPVSPAWLFAELERAFSRRGLTWPGVFNNGSQRQRLDAMLAKLGYDRERVVGEVEAFAAYAVGAGLSDPLLRFGDRLGQWANPPKRKPRESDEERIARERRAGREAYERSLRGGPAKASPAPGLARLSDVKLSMGGDS